jgi:hypothetical protein
MNHSELDNCAVDDFGLHKRAEENPYWKLPRRETDTRCSDKFLIQFRENLILLHSLWWKIWQLQDRAMFRTLITKVEKSSDPTNGKSSRLTKSNNGSFNNRGFEVLADRNSWISQLEKTGFRFRANSRMEFLNRRNFDHRRQWFAVSSYFSFSDGAMICPSNRNSLLKRTSHFSSTVWTQLCRAMKGECPPLNLRGLSDSTRNQLSGTLTVRRWWFGRPVNIYNRQFPPITAILSCWSRTFRCGKPIRDNTIASPGDTLDITRIFRLYDFHPSNLFRP